MEDGGRTGVDGDGKGDCGCDCGVNGWKGREGGREGGKGGKGGKGIEWMEWKLGVCVCVRANWGCVN